MRKPWAIVVWDTRAVLARCWTYKGAKRLKQRMCTPNRRGVIPMSWTLDIVRREHVGFMTDATSSFKDMASGDY